MVRTARNVLGRFGRNEVDDVVQEAFVAALTTSALPTGDLGAWLRAITARKALDSVRRARRRAERPLAALGARDGERASGAGGEAESSVHVLAVRRALAQLSAADRAVLVLVDLEGWSMADAGRVLGSTAVAVRLRAVRARRKLARLLRSGAARAEAPPDGRRRPR
jgi:RNA polymerase sigma-70 factor (ECF subfamily)